jgi:hypothetical protein
VTGAILSDDGLIVDPSLRDQIAHTVTTLASHALRPHRGDGKESA